ncbi:nitrate ABC transporter substrate-binding protein [Tepiditoga spiralis]|uniref:Nitrate ABC transporter substrate-binding protein n=1 Tax=Tepiditoga spiralis TaxID=2108365 RepID=A0A7G1G551_9BACT|nr:hypothetical protein [Tepiditoga spiralis]BBE30017.1 nitrate ABC transporter substrate-binding protein [Tepiditoga spiralis]
MKKFLIVSIILIVSVSIFSMSFYNPIGPTLLPAAGLYIAPPKDLKTNLWRTLDEAQTIVLKEQADFIVLPVAYGIQLINKGANYKLAGVSLWKTFYLVSSQNIKDVKQLEGKRVLTIHGPGQTADLILKMVKKEMNLNFDIVYVKSGADIIQLLASNKESIAVLPEPFVSLAEVKTKGKISPKLDIQSIYYKVSKSINKIPIAGLFIKNSINVSTANEIINAYRKSTNDFFINNTNEAIDFVVKSMGGKMPKPVIEKAAKRSEIIYKTDIGNVLNYLKILKKFNFIDNYSKDMLYLK